MWGCGIVLWWALTHEIVFPASGLQPRDVNPARRRTLRYEKVEDRYYASPSKNCFAICIGNTYSDPKCGLKSLSGDAGAEAMGSCLKDMDRCFKQVIVKKDVPSDVASGLPGQNLTDLVKNHLEENCREIDYHAGFLTFNGHGEEEMVFGNDGSGTDHDDLTAAMDLSCLNGTAKIMILDSCQGSQSLPSGTSECQTQHATTLPMSSSGIAHETAGSLKQSDFLTVSASGKGHISWGDSNGGLYTQELVNMFRAHWGKSERKMTNLSTEVQKNVQTRTDGHAVAANFCTSLKEDLNIWL